MKQRRISVCCYKKNAGKLAHPQYYARVREDGHTRDIPLHTEDKGVAETWVALRRDEIKRFNQYLLVGETPPAGLLDKVDNKVTTDAGKVVTYQRGLEEWEAHMHRRGLRETTIGSYIRAYRVTVPKDAQITSLDRPTVTKWLARHDKLKSATRKLYSCALREFVRFGCSEYGWDRFLLDDWPMVLVESATKNGWTLQQMTQIINNVRCRNPEVEDSMKAYLWVMATIGSRQGETAQLRWSDYADGKLTFRAEVTKTRKSRTVPLDPRISRLLDMLPKKSQYIFEDIPKSQPGRFEVLARAIKRSKMPEGGLHTFRHSVARIMYAKCTDITLVANLLGHSPMVSMRYYQEARSPEQLEVLVNDTFKDENMLPTIWDDWIKAGLI